MKVLVADKFEKSGLEGLQALGAEVISEPDLKDETLEQRIKESGAEVLVVRSTKVTAPMIQGSNLKVIIRAGAGYNTIDVEAASVNGVSVSNCPGKNSIAVAELVMGLIISIDRHIPDNVAQFREGRWNKKEFSKAKGLHGRTIGLIGFGNIGAEVMKLAKAFGMNVIVASKFLTPEHATDLEIESTDPWTLAGKSDIVSIHTSLRPDTRGLIDEKFFNAMKDGAYFINTSRAEVVDQDALERALESKKLFAGLDVFNDEPSTAEGEYSGSLKSNSRVYCTHHIGASTDQAQEAVAAETVRIVKEFMADGSVPNCVNPK